MKSLYEISKEALELASILEEEEFTPEMENALAINQNELQTKAIDYAYVIKSFESDVSAIDEELKRLQAIKKAKVNAVARMKETVLNAMQIYEIQKVETPTMKLSLRRSESTEILMEELINEKFKKEKISITIDKTAIKKAIKDGETVEGAIIKENFSLQIK